MNDGGMARHVVGKRLAWSPDGTALAYGSNDSHLCLWERVTTDDHRAAVRALAWSPWERQVLASGGGTADRSIKLWDATSSGLRTLGHKSVHWSSLAQPTSCCQRMATAQRETSSPCGNFGPCAICRAIGRELCTSQSL
ncbi:hypothetical protein ON010_g15720 [Phytophthora cinnamomi]|nr:hypothetical protein ON010_g15720 [Phytophthora cinnamomi]